MPMELETTTYDRLWRRRLMRTHCRWNGPSTRFGISIYNTDLQLIDQASIPPRDDLHYFQVASNVSEIIISSPPWVDPADNFPSDRDVYVVVVNDLFEVRMASSVLQ